MNVQKDEGKQGFIALTLSAFFSFYRPFPSIGNFLHRKRVEHPIQTMVI
jgi:hypothetical protein